MAKKLTPHLFFIPCKKYKYLNSKDRLTCNYVFMIVTALRFHIGTCTATV